MFDKIMLATDGSKTAEAAASQAAQLAEIAGATKIVVVHVCTGCTTDVDPDGENLRLSEKVVEQAAKAFRNVEAEVSTIVEVDFPPEMIGSALVEISDREKPDIIIIGSRGLSEFKGMLIGSVSNKVVQHASCPVLVVKK